jgi:hypothetical protein
MLMLDSLKSPSLVKTLYEEEQRSCETRTAWRQRTLSAAQRLVSARRGGPPPVKPQARVFEGQHSVVLAIISKARVGRVQRQPGVAPAWEGQQRSDAVSSLARSTSHRARPSQKPCSSTPGGSSGAPSLLSVQLVSPAAAPAAAND